MLRKKFFCLLGGLLAFAAMSSSAQKFNGYTLYSTQNSTSATLMDTNQAVYHTWSLTGGTGYSTHMVPGGAIYRAVAKGGNSFTGGPICGRVQKVDYNGNLLWQYDYSTTDYCSHHDICPMPNGNVLLIAYERRTAAEASAMGANNSIEMWPDKIVEIEPTGATTGNVVWEWKSWDHVMQNVDPNKPNYVSTLADHPERLNINYKQAKDWLHMNGVDYNPILDQIAFSSHNLNEWYIIDHSTTTAEAAGSTGGNAGKGGDILYRWGNPVAYGAAGTAILNVTHDAHWIPEGVPHAGRLAGFNNKGVSNNQSAADEIDVPLNGYTYTITPGQAYGPSTYTKRHAVNGYSSNMGSTQQLPNGNQLICVATSGKIYEIDSNGTQLWTKTIMGSIAQSRAYDLCYISNAAPAIPVISEAGGVLSSTAATTYQWYKNGVAIPGATAQTYTPATDGIYVVRITDANGCVYQYAKGYKFVKPNAIRETGESGNVQVFPNPSTGQLQIMKDGLPFRAKEVRITDISGRIIARFSDCTQLHLGHLPGGLYLIQMISEQGSFTQRIELQR